MWWDIFSIFDFEHDEWMMHEEHDEKMIVKELQPMALKVSFMICSRFLFNSACDVLSGSFKGLDGL